MGTIKNKDYIRLQTCSNCWICEGWTEHQFEFKPPEWVDYEVVPVKLHLSIDNYQGQIIEINGKLYKQYRGMGSSAAMKDGSAARYGHDRKDVATKAAAEGIEALKESVGSLSGVLRELVGGIQSGMGYLGASNLEQLRTNARYIRVSPAGQKESAPHDVITVKTSDASGESAK